MAIDLRGQQAQVFISALHPQTRVALEQALPQLHEMFAAQGLQLSQAQVGDQGAGSARDQQSDPRSGAWRAAGIGSDATGGGRIGSAGGSAGGTRSSTGQGLIDTFA